MSYQIKSTPLYRSIVSRSKKSGELQRLREEYERMRDFNDRTIEMKMRQVRLKRLFREIEDIKETRGPTWRRRRANAHKPKTPDQIRFDTLMRAKELGKEYSKLNAIMVERSTAKLETLTGPYPYPEFGYSIGALQSKTDVERKARSVKRINYGNEISRSNMRKITRAKRRRVVESREGSSYHHTEAKSESDVQLSRLRQRIDYGNSWSTINMTKYTPRYRKPKRSKPSMRSAQKLDCAKAIEPQTSTITAEDSSLLSTSEAQMFVEYQPMQPNLAENLSGYTTVQEFEVPSMPQIAFFQSIPDEHRRERALKNWHRVSLIVRSGVTSLPRRGPIYTANPIAPQSNEEEESISLRSAMASSATQIQMPIQQTIAVNQASQCNSEGLARPCIDERILQVENISRSSEEFALPVETPNSRVQNFIRMFEMSSRPSTSSKDDYVLASNKFTGIFTNTE